MKRNKTDLDFSDSFGRDKDHVISSSCLDRFGLNPDRRRAMGLLNSFCFIQFVFLIYHCRLLIYFLSIMFASVIISPSCVMR